MSHWQDLPKKTRKTPNVTGGSLVRVVERLVTKEAVASGYCQISKTRAVPEVGGTGHRPHATAFIRWTSTPHVVAQ